MHTAALARQRVPAAGPCVPCHADFDTQSLRWHDGRVRAVHDRDSLAWQPDAALARCAGGLRQRLAAFLAAHQDLRGGRRFTVAEQEIAWAAAHNARWEALHGDPPVSCAAVRAQAAERLRRAGVQLPESRAV